MPNPDPPPPPLGVDLKAGVKRRYSFRWDDRIQEVECVFATERGWETRPEAADGSWNVGHIGPFVIALRLP